MSRRNAEIVQGIYAAAARGNTDALLDAAHPEIRRSTASGVSVDDEVVTD
jgi:hypothetical protein